MSRPTKVSCTSCGALVAAGWRWPEVATDRENPAGPAGDLIHEAVRASARRAPSAPALVCAGDTVSYAELDRRSDETAEILAAAGVGPGNIVPVLLPPSVLLPVVLLAVLKTGAAYAALDTSWSGPRMQRIAGLLPGQVAVPGAAIEAFAGQRIQAGDDGSAAVSVTGPPPRIIAADRAAAMVFFTSGSTGEPKAVLSPHRAMSRLFAGCTFATFDQHTVMAQLAAVPWDAFGLELWGPLLTGGTCALVTERPLPPPGFREVIEVHGVTTVFLTTSLFHLMAEEDLTVFAGLRTLIVGGEKLSAPHAGRVLAAWPDLRLVNGYGPVESTVFALSHDVAEADLTGEIPLGRPVPRTGVLIMRRDGEFGVPCRPGEVGELCVTGDGLAIGYLSDPGLTAEKFVTVTVDGAPLRLYRTGDLGRADLAGVVHYHGRGDRQVKIRGRRIEPAGVERVAGAVPGVRRSLAVARRDTTGNVAGLWLFYLTSGGSPDEAEMTAALHDALPAYSVPDRVIAVDSFPLSANGKVDTGALLERYADPVAAAEPAPDPAPPPESPAGVVAAEIRGLLGLATVDPSASLFALGGTSLTAVRLCGRLAARFGRAVPVSRLMADPTVAGLGAWLAAKGTLAAESTTASTAGTTPEEADGLAGAPLTTMQQSFVLQNLRPGHDLVNHCLLSWTISGRLDPARLAGAVSATHARHGYLRAMVAIDDELRAVDSLEPAEFTQFTAPGPDEANRLLLERLSAPLEVQRGLVWRAVLVRDCGSGNWLFGVAVHHAVFDGWSEHVLARELSLAYAAAEQPGPASQPGARPQRAASPPGAAGLPGAMGFQG